MALFVCVSAFELLKKLADGKLNNCLILGVDFYNMYLVFLHTKNLKHSIK
jgi:hypothetical protein